MESPFESHSGFYLADNRQHRGLNPITRTTLEAKCSVLLPEWLVQDKTVLDLGSCLGAAGQWAMFYGAKSYVGVETQIEYVDKSRELLAHWGDKCNIIHGDILEYLSSISERSFDIVVAAGILYLFVGQKEIIDAICRAAAQYVVIESSQPQLLNQGIIKHPTAYFTEYRLDQGVNLATANASLVGISASSSVQALSLLFGLNGFKSNEGELAFPVSPDTAIYTATDLTKAGIPKRFAIRYQRTKGMQLQSLQAQMATGEGEIRDWKQDPKAMQLADGLKASAEAQEKTFRQWQFNEDVAKSFDTIADTSIPNYRLVLKKTIQIISKLDLPNPKIIDIGSATGNTLKLLYDSGFSNLYGVDSSADMLARSFNKATLIQSEDFPADHGPFDVIIANWVLHFIKNRDAYVRRICQSLNPDGVFIFSEKVLSSNMANELYHDFKREKGLSEAEIEQKKRQLDGVLVPYPLRWYQDILQEMGFSHFDIIDASYCFITVVASGKNS